MTTEAPLNMEVVTARAYGEVVLGVDTHKDVHVAVEMLRGPDHIAIRVVMTR